MPQVFPLAPIEAISHALNGGKILAWIKPKAGTNDYKNAGRFAPKNKAQWESFYILASE